MNALATNRCSTCVR